MTEARDRRIGLSAEDEAVLNGPEFDAQLRILCSFYDELSYEQKTELIGILSSGKLTDFHNTMNSMRPSSQSTPKAESSEGDEWVLQHN